MSSVAPQGHLTYSRLPVPRSIEKIPLVVPCSPIHRALLRSTGTLSPCGSRKKYFTDSITACPYRVCGYALLGFDLFRLREEREIEKANSCGQSHWGLLPQTYRPSHKWARSGDRPEISPLSQNCGSAPGHGTRHTPQLWYHLLLKNLPSAEHLHSTDKGAYT